MIWCLRMGPEFKNKLFSSIGSFVLGSAASLALQPYCLWYILILCLSSLYYLISTAKSPIAAFIWGWSYGFGYFTIGLYWIGNALLVEDNPYAWAWPLAIIGLPAFLSFFFALPCYFFKKFFVPHKLTGFLAFTCLLGLSDWLRGHILTGFPWNLHGHIWSNFLEIAQLAAVTDIYALSLITILWLSVPGFICLKPVKKTDKIVLPILIILTFLSAYTFGANRLESHKTTFIPKTDIVLIQPNIAQKEKWSAELLGDHFLKHLDLSKKAEKSKILPEVTYVIWPETAIPLPFVNNTKSIEMIEAMLQTFPNPAYLLTGAVRYVREDKSYRNSLITYDQQGGMTNIYDKSNLVPFGEYMPFSEIIDIAPIVGFSGFKAGPGPQTMETPEGFLYSPLVCYEIIFSGSVTSQEQRPQAIINVTNDGWYGISPGPYQHFAQAQFRAIEEGLPVIRVANTGFSGLIDPLGRIIYRSSLYSEESIKLNIPEALQNKMSSNSNNRLIIIAAFSYLLFLLVGTKFHPLNS